jgi:hypothetical protein
MRWDTTTYSHVSHQQGSTRTADLVLRFRERDVLKEAERLTGSASCGMG